MSDNSILHLVLGGSAGGCLRVACRSFGLPGIVHVIQDDLSHGPLNIGSAREKYLRDCYCGYEEYKDYEMDTLASWVSLNEMLDKKPIEQVCIWAGENASEKTFLGMACWYLRIYSGTIVRVGATGLSPLPYIGPHSPKALAKLFKIRQLLDKDDRAVLVESFVHTRDEVLTLRRWEEGDIISVPEDYYDSLLVGCCTNEWTSAARIVGEAMGRCDDHNLVGDVFLTSRLQRLIDNSVLLFNGKRKSLRDYRVRLAE